MKSAAALPPHPSVQSLAALSLAELLERPDLWRGSRLAGSTADGLSSGFAGLDAELPGGGWPPGALVEILAGSDRGSAPPAAAGELSLLLPTLAQRTQAGGWIVLVAPPLLPHAPAWVAAGVDLARLVVVAANFRDRLWAVERSLRCGAVDAVLAWLPRVEAQELRRLQLAAEEGGSTLFAFRPPAAAGHASPAPLRLSVQGATAGAQIRILKRRGPPLSPALLLPVTRPVAANGSFHHALACPPATRSAAGRTSLPTAA